MNFIEAMNHVAENNQTAVKREYSNTYVWFDQIPFMAGMGPLGFRCENDDTDAEVRAFVPSLGDIRAEDWSVYEPTPKPRL